MPLPRTPRAPLCIAIPLHIVLHFHSLILHSVFHSDPRPLILTHVLHFTRTASSHPDRFLHRYCRSITGPERKLHQQTTIASVHLLLTYVSQFFSYCHVVHHPCLLRPADHQGVWKEQQCCFRSSTHLFPFFRKATRFPFTDIMTQTFGGDVGHRRVLHRHRFF